MTEKSCLIAIDQGTTSTRALAFDTDLRELAVAQIPLEQHFPHNGWVEHDAAEIWQATLKVLGEVIGKAKAAGYTPLAVGITNQRETTVLWDRESGEPLHRAIVWQDRRTVAVCANLAEDKATVQKVQEQTGLLLDPYFSATKIAWLLDHVPGAREKAAAGKLAAGTIECYLAWRLTGGKSHVSDATNASRTMLMDIRNGQWSEDLCRLFEVPMRLLPEIVDNAGAFGTIADGLPGAGLPITGMIGDQQSAAVGQACIAPGQVKSTYGTGCFLLQHTGDQMVLSRNRLLSTVASRMKGKLAYAVEGSIFNAGTVIQWFRDGIGLIENSADSEAAAVRAGTTDGVYLVPAFTGLGAPHWAPEARGLISGLTRGTNADQLVRAGLESIAYQTNDLLTALKADGAGSAKQIRIDGGMAANGWFAQFLADICDATVDRPETLETTALGAAICAGIGAGVWPDLETATRNWTLDRRFEPDMDAGTRKKMTAGWDQAVSRCLLS